MSKSILLVSISLAALILLAGTQLTLFVVPKIGAVPEGKTLLMLRGDELKFIDSADAVRERRMGYVNLLCRGMVFSTVVKEGSILLKLPYFQFLQTFTDE